MKHGNSQHLDGPGVDNGKDEKTRVCLATKCYYDWFIQQRRDLKAGIYHYIRKSQCQFPHVRILVLLH